MYSKTKPKHYNDFISPENTRELPSIESIMRCFASAVKRVHAELYYKMSPGQIQSLPNATFYYGLPRKPTLKINTVYIIHR